MTDNIITVDLKHDGSAWIGPQRIVSPSRNPDLCCARSLRALGMPLDAIVHLRKLGMIVRRSTVGFLLRDERLKAAA
jgi:hypothetical protein